MTRQVIVLDDAERELAGAEAWYEGRRRGLGSEFLASIADALGPLG